MKNFKRIERRSPVKHRVGFFRALFLVIFLLSIPLSMFGVTLTRTSSNTIIFDDDYSTTEYVNPSGWNTHIARASAGTIQNNGMNTWGWDGPTVDISVSPNGVVYAVGEWTVYSDMVSDPPFTTSSGDYRPDLFLMRFDTSGNKKWSQAVRVRSMANSNVYFYNSANESKYVQMTTDVDDSVYVTFVRKDQAGSWHTFVQRINSDGSKPWGNEVEVYTGHSYTGAGVAVVGDSVFVLCQNGSNVYATKLNKADSSIVIASNQVNTGSYSTVNHPRLVAGPDGRLYAAWLNRGGIDIYGQALDTNLNRLTWGGDANDKRLNNETGVYSYGHYYYGWTEDELSIDMDDSTNLYVAWSAKKSGAFNAFAQKIDCSGNGFTRIWTNGNSDVMISTNSSLNGDVYVDINAGSSYVYASYITHDDGTNNDHMMLQRLSKVDGSKKWDPRLYTGLGHHGRIDVYNKCAYVTSTAVRVRKFDFNGTRIWDTYFLDRSRSTLLYYSTYKVLPGTVHEARVIQANTIYQPNAFFKYWVTSDGGNTVFGPLSITNQTGSVLFNNITNVGNDFRVYVVGDNSAQQGKNYIGVDELKFEATKIHLGDILVGKAPDASDAKGDLVLNEDSSGQSLDTYVYNNGTSAANAYFFIKNNGDFSYSSNTFMIQGSSGTADWTVKYWLCNPDGSTNLDITSDVVSGLVTNIAPFTNAVKNWVIIKAYLTPSISLSAGDSYAMNLQVYGNTSPTNLDWVLHDQATINGIISSALPDLEIYSKSDIKGYDLRGDDGSGQTEERIGDTNVTMTYQIRLRNAGGQDAIKTLSPYTGSSGWTVQYLTNGVDVTSIITNTQISNYLHNQEYFSNITVNITPDNSIGVNASLDVPLRSISYMDVSKVDRVIARYICVRTKPDLIVDSTGYGVYSTNNSQLVTGQSDNGMTNDYQVVLSNAGSYAMDFRISSVLSNGLDPEWKVLILKDGSQDVVNEMTNTYYTVSNLSAGGSQAFTVRILTPQTHNAGANEVMGVYLLAKGEGDYNNASKWDRVGIQHKTISSRVDETVEGSTSLVFEDPASSQYQFKYIKDDTNFVLTISNSANSAYNIVSKIQENGFGFDVVYSNAGADITSELQNGWTNSFTAGEVKTITVNLHVNTASVGDTYEADLRSYSLINSADVDDVKLKVERAIAPDFLIRKSTETSFHGDGNYGSDPTLIDQVSSSTFPQGSTNWYPFVMEVQNDRPSTESERVQLGSSTNAWEFKLYRYIGTMKDTPNLTNSGDWSEVTTSATNVGYVFANVASGDYEVLMLMLRAKNATNEGDLVQLDMTASGENTTYRDVVRVQMTYGMGLPDLVYNEGDVQATNGNDLYVSDYSDAVATNYADKSKGTLYHFLLQNDSISNPSSFVVRGTGSVGSWKVKYFDTNNNDITSFVIGSGYSLFVSNQSEVSLGVRVSASNSQLALNDWTNVDIYASTEMEELRDYLRIQTFVTDLGSPDLVLGNNGDGVRDTAQPATLGTNIGINWGETLTVPVVIQNDRNLQETLRIYGSAQFSSWDIHYQTNGVDVTADVTNYYASGQPYVGGFDLTIPANSAITMDVKVTLASNCGLDIGSEHDFYVYTYSEGRLIRDGALIKAIVTDSGKPDLVASSDSGWNNVYENAPSIQSLQTNTEKGWLHQYELYLQNDRSSQESLKFRGIGNTNNWQISYLYYDTGLGGLSNITSMVTNSNFTFLMPSLSSVTLQVQTLIPTNAGNALDSTLDLDMQAISWMGFVTDSVQLVDRIKDMTVPDLSFTNGLWNDSYESVSITPASTSNLLMEKGQTNIFYLWLENDSTVRTNTFYLSAPAGSGNWAIGYEYSNETASIFSNVTYEVTHHESLVTLAPGGKTLLRVFANVPTNASMQTNSVFNIDLDLESFFGQNHDLGRIALRYVDKGDPDLVFGTNRSGNDLREAVASLQKAQYPMEWGDEKIVPVYVQNDRSDSAENLTLYGNPPGNPDFSIQYLKLNGTTTNDISSSITNYSGLMELIPAQTELTMLVKMQISSNSSLSTNSVNVQHINLKLVSFVGAYTDNVALDYAVVDLSKPDVYISDVLSWSNFSEYPAVQQTTNISLEMGHTNIVEYFIENGRAKSEEFKFKVSRNVETSKNWQVFNEYFNGSWSNVADLVTNTWTNVMSGNSTKRMRAMIFVPYDDGQAFTNNLGETSSLDFRMQSWMGYQFDEMKVHYALSDLGKPNIRKMDQSWAVVENIPVNQIETIPIEKGITNIHTVLLTNEQADFNRFKLLATVSEWNTEYWLSNSGGWTNVTSIITNGFFEDFSANESKILKVVQFAPYSDTNNEYAVKNLDISLHSYRSVTVDNVRLSYQLKDLSKPDIVLGTNSFNDLYNFYGDTQVTNIDIEKLESVTVSGQYQNDSDRSYNYVFQAKPLGTNWGVTYEVTNGGTATNITTFITNAGFTNFLTNNEVGNGSMSMTLLDTSGMISNEVLTNWLRMYSLAKLKVEEVNILYHWIDRGDPSLTFTNGTSVSNLLMKKGDTNIFALVVTNRRTDSRFASEKMLLKLSPYYLEGWGYKVLLGSIDVTASVTNGGVICDLSNGGVTNILLQVSMDVSNTNSSGSTNQIDLEVYSQGRQKKSVASVQVIKQEPRPDLTVISISGEGVVGEDVYTSDVSNQNILGYVIVSKSATYSIILENDDVIPDTIDMSMGDTFDTNKWVLEVEDDDLGIDVTSNFINGTSYSIGAGKHKMFIFTVIARNTVGMNETNTVIFTAKSESETNKVDRIAVYSVRVPVTVEGIVKSQAGVPLENAKVQFNSLFSDDSAEGTTDKDGKYSLKMVPGTFQIHVSRSGYVDYSAENTVQEVKLYQLDDISLLPVNLDTTTFDAHVFPNPIETRQASTFVINHLESGLLKMQIYDLKGKLLKTFFNETKDKGVYTVQWDGRSDEGIYLTRGIYLLIFQNGSKVKLKKIFIK